MSSTILLGMLVLGLALVFSIPTKAEGSSVDGSPGHAGWYHGIAYLAEKEIRTREQKLQESDEVSIARTVVVTPDEKEKGYLDRSEETDTEKQETE
jgi:hypothetical protein